MLATQVGDKNSRDCQRDQIVSIVGQSKLHPIPIVKGGEFSIDFLMDWSLIRVIKAILWINHEFEIDVVEDFQK